MLPAIVLWAFPCAFADGSRGKLSDAMEKASTEHEGTRTVPAEPEDSKAYEKQSCSNTCLGLSLDFFLDILTSKNASRQEAVPATPEIEIPANTGDPEFSTANEDETSLSKGPPTEDDSDGEAIGSGRIETEKNIKEAPSRFPLQTAAFDSSKTRKKSPWRDTVFIFNGGIGVLKQDDFHPLQYLQIGIGVYTEEHLRFEAYVGGAWASVKETSNLDESIEDGIGIATGGVQLNYFFTPRHTFLGAYALGGVAYNHLFWYYENPIHYENETIYGDDLEGFELYTGLGLSITLFSSFQIGAEVAPGFLLWGPTTSEGFENDVFGPFSSIKFKSTFTYLF